MNLTVGMKVEHPDFGIGTIEQLLGSEVVVNFFGESIGINTDELTPYEDFTPEITDKEKDISEDKVNFRRAYEAVNLGVVPPDPTSLIAMTIAGNQSTGQVRSWLENAETKGICKVFFGYYGAGKSHYLHMTKAIALEAGWVVAFLEFDPKAADPAKPFLVYRGLMSNLTFPKREDGSITTGFSGLIKEVRKNWDIIRNRPFLKKSPWFKNALETLIHYPHSEDHDYLSGCEWLAGQHPNIKVIRDLARGAAKRPMSIPIMPRVRENAEIYVFHLVLK